MKFQIIQMNIPEKQSKSLDNLDMTLIQMMELKCKLKDQYNQIMGQYLLENELQIIEDMEEEFKYEQTVLNTKDIEDRANGKGRLIHADGDVYEG